MPLNPQMPPHDSGIILELQIHAAKTSRVACYNVSALTTSLTDVPLKEHPLRPPFRSTVDATVPKPRNPSQLRAGSMRKWSIFDASE